MSNGEVCCLLRVCCDVAARRTNVIKAMVKDGFPQEYAEKAFDWFDERADFAPKGTLDSLVDAVASMAHKHPPHGV